MILTESKARLYFGEYAPADMINKTIIYNDSLNVRVAGIVKDPAKNSDFFFRDFISFATLKKDEASQSWNDAFCTVCYQSIKAAFVNPVEALRRE